MDLIEYVNDYSVGYNLDCIRRVFSYEEEESSLLVNLINKAYLLNFFAYLFAEYPNYLVNTYKKISIRPLFESFIYKIFQKDFEKVVTVPNERTESAFKNYLISINIKNGAPLLRLRQLNSSLENENSLNDFIKMQALLISAFIDGSKIEKNPEKNA